MKTYPPVETLPGVVELNALWVTLPRVKVRWHRSYEQLNATVGWHRPGSLPRGGVNATVQTYEQQGRGEVQCWCQRRYVWVPLDEIRHGHTHSCGRVECREVRR